MDFRRMQVLTVTADPAIVAAVEARFSETGVGADLHHAQDDGEAGDFVHGRAAFEGAEWPDILVLDAAVGDDGVRRLLQTIAADEQGRRLPVLVMADDPDEAAVALAAERVHDIVDRPPAADDLRRLISYLNEF